MIAGPQRPRARAAGDDYPPPRGLGRAAHYAALWLLGALFVLPLFWMVSSSLKPDYEIFANPPVWWPSSPRWANYVEALTAQPFGRYTLNTLIIALASVAGHVLSCTVVAYGFARLHAPGREPLFLLVLATLMLPYPVTMVPLYILFARLGWVNTFLPLIVPTFFGNALYIFLLRQFFLQLPSEVEDAAQIDGASLPQILWYIILPMATPALATVMIFSFQAAWNDFLGPLIFLQDQSKYTLMLGLSLFRGSYQIEWAHLLAASLVVMLPVIVLFFAAQRAFIEGINLAGVRN
ncbi:MAG: sugar ABC transporter ATP-binding protein [Chloroflexi bacterium]|nr:MAG: sugar ABC transporter ATP-binding protein [Chloroflexota bacterium]